MSEKKAVLVVSFGTSYEQSIQKSIKSIEERLGQAFPDCCIKRAFTSNMIIKKLRENKNINVDTVPMALERLADAGYTHVIIQPTFVMNGEEFDNMKKMAKPFESRFSSVKYGTPLLTASEDYAELIQVLVQAIPHISQRDNAVVFMGHGTEHFANSAYAALAYRFGAMDYANVFVGTVEGYPDFERIKAELNSFKPRSVILVPLMIVAGDHVNNDMAGDNEESWKTQLLKEGYNVECILKGLGEYDGIRDIFADHALNAV